jgi:phosphinothricin acetyltransferase
MIRPVRAEDAEAICSIYNYYVENTIHTFEEKPLQIDEMRERIRGISAKYPYLVWEDELGEVNGFAYINTWKEREAYRFSAELSVYIKEGLHGMGIGRSLMEKLLEEARKTEIHSLVSGIVLPNDASVSLHEKFGFVKIGLFREIGYKLNKWLDVGYWELILK